MGLNSPTHNVKGNTINRPPVNIFVGCLILCGFTILSMGFYVQYSSVVLNPNVKGKWLKFLSKLSLLDICVTTTLDREEIDPEAIAQFIDGGTSNSTNEVSVTVSASVHLISDFKKLPPSGMVAASGTVNLGGWAVIQDGRPIHSLKMTFVVPPGLTEISDKEACVILTVPPGFLPLSKRSSVCVPSFLNKTITHVGSLFEITPNSSDPICKSGAYVKLKYNRKSEQDFYLSKAEKWSIYLRLVHVSYFLFATAIILICFCLLRSRAYTPPPPLDKNVTGFLRPFQERVQLGLRNGKESSDF